MKKGIAVTALSVALAVSGFIGMKSAHGSDGSPVELCDKYGGVAFTLMLSRQMGHDKKMFLDAPETTPYAAGMINRAWSKSVEEGVEKAYSARDFERAEYQRCLKKFAI